MSPSQNPVLNWKPRTGGQCALTVLPVIAVFPTSTLSTYILTIAPSYVITTWCHVSKAAQKIETEYVYSPIIHFNIIDIIYMHCAGFHKYGTGKLVKIRLLTGKENMVKYNTNLSINQVIQIFMVKKYIIEMTVNYNKLLYLSCLC